MNVFVVLVARSSGEEDGAAACLYEEECLGGSLVRGRSEWSVPDQISVCFEESDIAFGIGHKLRDNPVFQGWFVRCPGSIPLQALLEGYCRKVRSHHTHKACTNPLS